MIKSLCWLAFEQLPLSVAFSSLTIYLSNDWWRCFLLIAFDQLDEVLRIDEYLAFMLYLLTFLRLEPILSLRWSLIDYEIAILFIFFWFTEITRLHSWLLWLVILKDLELFDCWSCCLIPLPEGKLLLAYLFALVIQYLGLAMMAMRLDDIKDVLGLGGCSIAVIIAFNDRLSNDSSDHTFAIRPKDIIRVFVILKLQIQIFNYFIRRFHLLLVALYLNVQLHLHICQFLDLGEIFHPAGSLFE